MSTQHILRNHLLILLILATLTTLTSCGGDGDDGTTSFDAEDLSLNELNVAGYQIQFNKNITGPYEIEIDSTVNTLTIRAATESLNASLFYTLTHSDNDTDQLEFESGHSFEIEVKEGSNRLSIYVLNEQSLNFVAYTLIIRRVSSSAQLSQLQVFGSSEEIILSPGFSPNIYNYTTEVAYNDCTYAARVVSSRRDNELSIGNKAVESYEFFYQNLDVGDNYVDIFVKSGDALRTERYSVLIKRPEPTETQLNKNPSLKSITIEGSDVDFYCNRNLYAINVNSNVESILVTLNAEVNGIEIYHGDTDIESARPTEIELESGNSLVQIDTYSLDKTVSKSYQIYVNRLTSNRVYVDTATELQTALKNANPNDEIRVLPGVYQGIPGLVTSGSSDAGFFSARSGSALLPIYVSVDDLNEDTILKATQGSTVLQLQGAHWNISGLAISSGTKGIQLQGAEFIHLYALDISEVDDIGIEFLASSNNSLVDSSITTSAQALNTAGGIPTLIHIGSANESNTLSANNIISRNSVDAAANTYALVIDSLAQETVIQSNTLSVVNNEETEIQRSIMEIKGNDSLIRYNSFYPNENTTGAIAVHNANTAEIYQNVLDRSFLEQPLVHAESGANILVAENFLTWKSYDEDEHDSASYAGSNITLVERLSPKYKIRTLTSPDSCLGLTADDDNSEFYYVQLKPCSDAEDLYWEMIFSSDKYVYIKNTSVDEGYLMPPPNFTDHCESIPNATSIAFLTNNISGYAQQWAIYQEDQAYTFSNKFNPAYALTVGGNTYTSGTPLVACPQVNSERQKFTLEIITN